MGARTRTDDETNGRDQAKGQPAGRPGGDTTNDAGDDGADPGPSSESPKSPWERPLTDRALLAIVAAVTLPILWMGYGTDIDVSNVLRTVEKLQSGTYEPSRTPGVPVVEAIVTPLDWIGGHLLVNLATAGAAAALVVGLARLVRAWGHANGDLVALAFFASPMTIIASTSMADFVWALAFFVWGALVQLADSRPFGSGTAGASRSLAGERGRGRPSGWWPDRQSLLAGLLFALAIGSRLSTGFVIAAFLIADGWDASRRGRCARSAIVAVPLGALLYVPSWLAFDRSFAFLETADGYRGFASNLGLFLYKNYVMAGLALIVVCLVAVPALVQALRAWGRDPMLRFAALSLLATQALFFQLPWKLAHLLPCLLAALLLVAATSLGRSRRFLWVMAAAVAVNGIVTFRPLAPDEPSEATTGSWNPAISAGLLVNDVDCRLEYMQRPPTQRNVERAWSCHLIPLRGPADVG